MEAVHRRLAVDAVNRDQWPRQHEQVDRAIAEDLIGDVNLAATGVPGPRNPRKPGHGYRLVQAPDKPKPSRSQAEHPLVSDDGDQIAGRACADRRGVRCVEPVGGNHEMPSAMRSRISATLARSVRTRSALQRRRVWAIPSANWRIGKTCDRQNMPNG